MDLNTIASAPAEVVENQKVKWQEVVSSGYLGIDDAIVDILDVMNKLPGVVTVWSCAGHLPSSDRKGKDQFYIRLIATEQGIELVADVYQRIIDDVNLQRSQRRLIVRLKRCTLVLYVLP